MSDASPQGILVCDKLPGLTSHGVVSRIRRWFGTRKVGHAGTLDPMATGVLVLGLGRGTKLLTHITGATKSYTATIRLGAGTPTDDADSDPDVVADPQVLSVLTDAQIAEAVAGLRGPIDQVPSAVSAIKVDGKRAYARVRAGENFVLEPRRVVISRFDILDQRRTDSAIDLDVVVDCTSGTYIRALARDLGSHLGVHGHLTALRRTRVGPFDLTTAVTIPDDLDEPSPPLIPLAEAAAAMLPLVEVDEGQATALMQGKALGGPWTPRSTDADIAATEVAVLCGGELVSVAEVRGDGSLKSRTAFAIDLA